MYRIGTHFIAVLVVILNTCSSTPLDDYVNAADPIFSWKLLQTYPRPTQTVYLLNLTSQQWMDASFSSRPIWWHHLIITVPRVIRRRMAYLMIDGGSNDDILSTDFFTTWIPASADAITVSVRQVPNQPIRIWTDPSNNYLFEDPLLAWTWNKFHEENGSNPNVLLELPMTKAVVRAMDATQQFLQQQHMVVPEKFILAGHSKRGWATWTTTAVENTRVIAAIPLAMGLLNFRPNWKSHYRSLGGWSFAFADYYARNFSRYLDKSSYDKFTQIVDPYSYFSRFANVKLFLIQSTGDEFFMPDSEDFFWDELQSATSGSYLRYMPNTGHGLGGFHESLISFYLTIADQQILPSFKWERSLNQTHGKIRATIDFSAGKPKPTIVTAYHARTSDNSKRDFRQQKLDSNNGQMVPSSITWANTAVLLEEQSDTYYIYSITLPIPSGYWEAAFIQATFQGRDATNLVLTTQTMIVPKTYPTEECYDQECYGKLV